MTGHRLNGVPYAWVVAGARDMWEALNKIAELPQRASGDDTAALSYAVVTARAALAAIKGLP